MISNSYYKFLDWQIKNLAIDASPYDHCTFHYDRETKSYVDDGCLVVCWYKVIKDEDGDIHLEYNHMETVKEYEDKYKEKFGTIEDVGEKFYYPIPTSDAQKQWENILWLPKICYLDLETIKVIDYDKTLKSFHTLYDHYERVYDPKEEI